MSSGSSGHNVTAPEPLCSMLLLISRMLPIRALFLVKVENVDRGFED